MTYKTLRISKTFGIEGKKLLTPEDDYDALKDFNEAYEGHETPLEALHLEYQKLLAADPTLTARLDAFPQRIFSGKQHLKPGTRAVFFCYARPGPDEAGPGYMSVTDGYTPVCGHGYIALDIRGVTGFEIADRRTHLVGRAPAQPVPLGERPGQHACAASFPHAADCVHPYPARGRPAQAQLSVTEPGLVVELVTRCCTHRSRPCPYAVFLTVLPPSIGATTDRSSSAATSIRSGSGLNACCRRWKFAWSRSTSPTAFQGRPAAQPP